MAAFSTRAHNSHATSIPRYTAAGVIHPNC